MMTGNKELTDKFGTQYGYFDELLGRVSGGGAYKNKQEKQDLSQYFMYQRKLLSSRGYGKIVNIDKLSVFEAQKAIEWAMQGVSPDDIEQAILKSRQGQKK